MLYYQRAGQAKDAAHAGEGWTDAASFVGPGQDHDCRLYRDTSNASTARDLWGGWYDAGDLNKYTTWTAGYVQTLLRAYAENPTVWTDDYDIPESGNGIPDVLDEARWGLDYLGRLQQDDGSMLSIVGEPGASPPSSATDPAATAPPPPPRRSPRRRRSRPRRACCACRGTRRSPPSPPTRSRARSGPGTGRSRTPR
jgi:hypothetical protein